MSYGSTPPPPPPGSGGYGAQPPMGPAGGMPYGGAPMSPPPQNNLVLAILATVLCCLPLGIVAILKANKVNTLWAQGDQAGAHAAAAEAKKWSIISAILGIVVGIIYFVFVFLAAANGSVTVR
ncbi:MAG: CD225/dispanin family protein [Actinomycetales bacterium]|jgi:hypothetical protein|uniref:CD225/dispanin family protein n=1 Tax=Candidatus Phosphoribacter hodrii TaxID=2953743 RepID=A0A934X651_9MICO|nr:CD225/dispanin family protein [Candidatus Phosphoribacter hodrii]OPZ55092.1 MAG: Interferon-induced transmembrane protein [bacterium ADurb.BinA028]HOR15787.1 CD225/dispanin family protein [Dermatophilaceae bacterium]MBK7274774.1 CD225/dispanin family protein [Candidatus Phosphoribacter hodrii]MBL0004528.1 CD225/dispanin family protein [Candidatus Phosphoribacter hodrii]